MKETQDDYFDPSAEKAGIATFESAALETGDDREFLLDHNGLPLVPQPSRFKDDPLVCRPVSRPLDQVLIRLELAIMAQMGCSTPSLLHGHDGTFQLRRHQSISRYSRQSF